MNTQWLQTFYDVMVNVVVPVGYLVGMYYIHTHLKAHNPKMDELITQIEKLVEAAAESNVPADYGPGKEE